MTLRGKVDHYIYSLQNRLYGYHITNITLHKTISGVMFYVLEVFQITQAVVPAEDYR